MGSLAPPKSSIFTRQVGVAVVIDIVGKVALAQGTALLRETIRALLEQGNDRILLNLASLDFIDSAGLGELVRTHVAVRSRGGQLKLVKPTDNVNSLLKVTRLDTVFEIEPDESTALRSFQAAAGAASTT
jgi:anti-sigma B factor antagonist